MKPATSSSLDYYDYLVSFCLLHHRWQTQNSVASGKNTTAQRNVFQGDIYVKINIDTNKKAKAIIGPRI